MTDRNFENLTDVVDYYAWKQHEEKDLFRLSKEQRSQLEEVRDRLYVYLQSGCVVAELWLECADELLN